VFAFADRCSVNSCDAFRRPSSLGFNDVRTPKVAQDNEKLSRVLHKLDEPSLADVRTLKTAAKKKTRAANIARSLKRTEGATRQKAFSLGLSLDSRG